MIFNMNTSGESLKLPTLDNSYPKDASVTYKPGNSASATFAVSIIADGIPAAYTYQWYVNGSAVSGATSSSYTRSGLNAAGTYTVYCKVSNKAGTVTSRTATLKVTADQYVPVLNAGYPSDATVEYEPSSSATATFAVKIATDGNPASYTYQWYVNGDAVSGATSSSYTKTDLNTETTYTVYCRVTNTAGTVVSRTATLTVKPKTLAFFDGTLNTDVFGAMTGNHIVNSPILRVYGAGNGSATINTFTCSNYVDISSYKTLSLVVSKNESAKCAVRIRNNSNKQVAAMTITASNTGTFNIDLSSITGLCKPALDVSSNSTSNYLEFSSIVFYP